MPTKKYKVTLTLEERTHLLDLVSKGKASAKKLTHARVLLQADESEKGTVWNDAHICEALHVSHRTVERMRKIFVEEGIEAAITRKSHSGYRPRKLDGEQEAHLIALACSSPPAGRKRWTLKLLSSKLVELKYIERIAKETVRQTLKKTNSNPG